MEESKILNENFNWIKSIIKVSKKLYSTGKISQQALLDIEIRKTEIERDMSNKKFEYLKIGDELNYLIGHKHIDESSIPWSFIEKREKDLKNLKDHKDVSFKEKVKAKKLSVKVTQLNYIPDIIFSAGTPKDQILMIREIS